VARIRSIKPDFTQNDKLSALPAETHLLAAGLICYADDEGYFPANPKLVQAAIFPLRELLQSIPEMLRNLSGIGYLELFTGSDDRAYGKITHFDLHQRVSHKVGSKIKALRAASGNIPENSGRPPETLRPELKGNRIEGEFEGEDFPESTTDQPPLNHAKKIMEVLGLSERIVLSVEAGLKAEAGFSGNSLPETAQYIVKRAIADRQEGISIDKFYFDDTKWRNGNGKGTRPSASAARSERSKSNILDGLAKDIGRRDAPVRPELEIGTRKRTGSGI
jgi:hypothetical protein